MALGSLVFLLSAFRKVFSRFMHILNGFMDALFAFILSLFGSTGKLQPKIKYFNKLVHEQRWANFQFIYNLFGQIVLFALLLCNVPWAWQARICNWKKLLQKALVSSSTQMAELLSVPQSVRQAKDISDPHFSFVVWQLLRKSITITIKAIYLICIARRRMLSSQTGNF